MSVWGYLEELDPEGDALPQVAFRQEPRPEPAHIVFFNRVDLYHKSPDSGERQYISRTRKMRFEPRPEPAQLSDFISEKVCEKSFCHEFYCTI